MNKRSILFICYQIICMYKYVLPIEDVLACMYLFVLSQLKMITLKLNVLSRKKVPTINQ